MVTDGRCLYFYNLFCEHSAKSMYMMQYMITEEHVIRKEIQYVF
jgi:Mn-containing catalase